MTKEELFENNIAIAYKIANTYKINYSNEYEDIKQEALLGLWKACLNFNGKYAFSTFAYPCIRNTIDHYLRTVRKHLKNDKSINEPIGDDIYLEDIIESENSDIDLLIEEIHIDSIKKDIPKVLENDRESIVFNLYLKGKTQQEIGKELGVSQAQISRIKNRVTNKINNLYVTR